MINLPNLFYSQVNAACASQAFVVPGLLEGQDYLFRVRAENRLGFGPFTETTEPIRARDPICKDNPSFPAAHIQHYISIIMSIKFIVLLPPPQTHLTPQPS